MRMSRMRPCPSGSSTGIAAAGSGSPPSLVCAAVGVVVVASALPLRLNGRFRAPAAPSRAIRPAAPDPPAAGCARPTEAATEAAPRLGNARPHPGLTGRLTPREQEPTPPEGPPQPREPPAAAMDTERPRRGRAMSAPSTKPHPPERALGVPQKQRAPESRPLRAGGGSGGGTGAGGAARATTTR